MEKYLTAPILIKSAEKSLDDLKNLATIKITEERNARLRLAEERGDARLTASGIEDAWIIYVHERDKIDNWVTIIGKAIRRLDLKTPEIATPMSVESKERQSDERSKREKI